eukprot:gnl/MRDRNA2_/MRDRNA2_31012_c0_seq1.p1 gnl/MRDRNA2_/MRDRNA2_31012_c0~~gnl/MRDRNA2_/MRDRNA2_31012_c0_seq1.p1  ORF type:complete len:226 (+),score=44.26 gnl/MRDRNA2_/MRDRNA2_31012_c0_seq1:99-776(+)
MPSITVTNFILVLHASVTRLANGTTYAQDELGDEPNNALHIHQLDNVKVNLERTLRGKADPFIVACCRCYTCAECKITAARRLQRMPGKPIKFVKGQTINEEKKDDGKEEKEEDSSDKDGWGRPPSKTESGRKQDSVRFLKLTAEQRGKGLIREPSPDSEDDEIEEEDAQEKTEKQEISKGGQSAGKHGGRKKGGRKGSEGRRRRGDIPAMKEAATKKGKTCRKF